MMARQHGRMDPSQRVVVQMPLRERWDPVSGRAAIRQRDLGRSEIVAMLHQGLVRFIVADCGHPLRWISAA